MSSTCGSVGISGTNNAGAILPVSSSSPSSSIGIAVSTNCPGYSTTGISTACNIANTQITTLQPGTGLNTSGGTIQLLTTMEASNSQQEDFIATSTSNNSAANIPQSRCLLLLIFIWKTHVKINILYIVCILNQSYDIITITDVREYHGGRLTHQPSSLDDLDEADTIPFDNVPLRYDTTGKIIRSWNMEVWRVLYIYPS